jgi:hypothetical protein
MSMTVSGCMTSSFIRSSKVVPSKKFDIRNTAGIRGDARGGNLHRFRLPLRALIDKSAHDYCVLAVFITDRACFTASTMFG